MAHEAVPVGVVLDVEDGQGGDGHRWMVCCQHFSSPHVEILSLS